MSILKTIKQAQDLLQLLSEIQKLDANGNGVADVVEFIKEGTMLLAKINEAKEVVIRIEKLFGADVFEIRKRLGV